MPVSFVDGDAVSGLRIHARLLSVATSASGRRVQAEPAVHTDAAVYCLRISRLHEERNHWAGPTASLCSFFLPLGLAGANDFLLGVSQHALVSVSFLEPVSEARAERAHLGGRCAAILPAIYLNQEREQGCSRPARRMRALRALRTGSKIDLKIDPVVIAPGTDTRLLFQVIRANRNER